jgi:hypothetical protein
VRNVARNADAAATGWAIAALTTARFFGRDVPIEPEALLAWFDATASTTPLAAGAELLSRFFAGQDPRTVPKMATLADTVLAQANIEEPHTAYWASHALYQLGGRHWATWSKNLSRIQKTRVAEAEDKGSWDPAAGLSRLETTALNVLTLEAYYRYSRLVR